MYGSATAGDTILTTALVMALWKSRTGLKRYVAVFTVIYYMICDLAHRSDSVIQTIIAYTVNTGTLRKL